jgi:urease accessory protein UreH
MAGNKLLAEFRTHSEVSNTSGDSDQITQHLEIAPSQSTVCIENINLSSEATTCQAPAHRNTYSSMQIAVVIIENKTSNKSINTSSSKVASGKKGYVMRYLRL